MESQKSIPILLCAQIESHIAAATKGLLPEFEIIHVARTNEECIRYLNEAPVPAARAAIMGGQYSNDDLYHVQSTGALKIPFIRPQHTRPGSALPKDLTAGASSENVMKSVKVLLLEHQQELASAESHATGGEGKVWYYKMIDPGTS